MCACPFLTHYGLTAICCVFVKEHLCFRPYFSIFRTVFSLFNALKFPIPGPILCLMNQIYSIILWGEINCHELK